MSKEINYDRRRFLGAAAVTTAAALLGIFTLAKAQFSKTKTEDVLPALGGATGWLNSPPLTAADLRGKVVLIDFWTYTCINWLRTLAYVRAWAIQLLCEDSAPAAPALEKFATLAKSDRSPVVRLYLASALQRLPHEKRWPIAEALAAHREDAADHNLPNLI